MCQNRNGLVVLAISLAVLPATSSLVFGIVTSDGFGTHQTTPGQAAFGVNVDGVSRLFTYDSNWNSLGTCTASDITYGGILTAGHCLSNPNIFSAIVSYDVPGLPSYSAYLADWEVHPAFNGVPGTGYDVGVAQLYGPLWPTPTYEIYRGESGSEVGDDVVKVGYGATGYGGYLGSIFAAGDKRAGRNTIDELGLSGPEYAVDDDLDNLARPDQQLTYDFDSGAANEDGFARLFGHPADTGFGNDEVIPAGGDSGGPAFAFINGQWRIVGVNSYGISLTTNAGVTSDIDATQNNTWGEFDVDTRIASPAIHRFIDHYFAWGTSGGIIGDLNSNGDLDGGDIDLIFDNISDLDGNGVANSNDVDFLVEQLSGTAYGDVDLDRDVDMTDWNVFISNYGQSNRTWSQGDFNGDSIVNYSDYQIFIGNYGFDENLGVGAGNAQFNMAVPEPAGPSFALCGVVLASVILRRKRMSARVGGE